MRNHIRIGTRKSALALWQSEYVKSELQRLYPGVTVELVHFNTKGDRILNKPLAEVGGKGLFTAELSVQPAWLLLHVVVYFLLQRFQGHRY